MESSKKIFNNIDEYIAASPAAVQPLLQNLRNTINKAAPKCQEIISYNMPAFRGYRTLVYFAVHKAHIGFYPTAEPIKVFSEELKDFTTSKGAIQFPFEKGIPVALVKKIVAYRVKSDEMKRVINEKKRK